MTWIKAERTIRKGLQRTRSSVIGGCLLVGCWAPVGAAEEVFRSVGPDGEVSFSDVPTPNATAQELIVHQPTERDGELARARAAELAAAADELATARAEREQERQRDARSTGVQSQNPQHRTDDGYRADDYRAYYPLPPWRPNRPPHTDDRFTDERPVFAPPPFGPPAFTPPQPVRAPMRRPESSNAAPAPRGRAGH